ncbi:PRC-barrel domain-containing protein [Geothrix sp. 21YS21S-2]|uniref:PRC-barrel domain-containing protein n=1 Tax=Geothrix sp. 21YS21S-2 TaxID=3068893 RepID=UPI0027B8E4A8|nr:PRC-barrel domain-containing protein [Geothrix sp. 21YS21S-2]
MLRSLKDLEGYAVAATDGALGTVANFLVEDAGWTCRYLVVSTGTFFDEREVLISPMFFRQVEWGNRTFHLALTRKQIRESPGANADLPVSRQHERDYYRYFGYPNYWGSTGVWGTNAAPLPILTDLPVAEIPLDIDTFDDDPHLRSVKFIRGYHLHATDGDVGHVDDFIVDDETWQIRYLVVSTGSWFTGRQVLVSPLWATQVSWEENTIDLCLTRQEIKDCPEWDPGAPVNRSYEKRLFDYYGRPVYWDSPSIPADPRDEIL